MSQGLHIHPPSDGFANARTVAAPRQFGDDGGLSIAHVVFSLDCGGLENVVLELVREGRRRGHRMRVICVERAGELASRVEDAGAELHCLGKRPGLSLRVVRRQLTGLLREHRPDVLHSHQIGALFYAGPAARAAAVPVVVHTEHGKHYASRLRTRWLGRWAARSAARFFCVSADIATAVMRFRVAPPDKVAVLPNGIDVERFRRRQDVGDLRRSLGIEPGAPVVGTVGRLAEVKRQDLLIRGFARLLEGVPDAHLLFVGDGPLRGDLEALSESLGIAGRVHFAGYQEQRERYLQLMNVFALTSRSEGMPLAVLEAWSAGIPVVASRVGGLPEMIGEDQRGSLVPFGDERALAEALRRLIDRPDESRRVAGDAFDHVSRNFSVQAMASGYLRNYSDLLAT